MLLPEGELVQVLLRASVLDQKGLDALLVFAKNARMPLEDALVEKGVITDENLGTMVANYLKLPFINLSKISIPEEAFRIIPEKVARKFQIISFARDATTLKLATTNPKNKEILDVIAKKTGSQISLYLAMERDIENTLRVYRKNLQERFDQLLEQEVDIAAVTGEDMPIAKIVDLLIIYAFRDKASDIHIEPEEKCLLMRFRIDGILHDVLNIDKKYSDRIITRIKVLSRLRTDEHMSAQDGKMRMKIDDNDLDLRVSIIPIADGEKVVLRLLSSQLGQISLSDLGMKDEDLKKVNSAVNKSFGMILSTGPTGSGKTTSIYSLLKVLNTREKNITTIEDPIEYKIAGVNQIQVNVKTNLTFANGLRSVLRQDPNVIFVGEIRDNETAGIAVNAALTGHLVLSTLHTNDAATALPRLIDMKVEPFLVGSTVNVIIAQRLIRKICEGCKIPYKILRSSLLKSFSEETMSKYFPSGEELTVYQGKGCKLCHFTGYSSRIGIFEVMEITEKIRKLISDKSDSDVINKEAKAEGMTTMFEDGLIKVARGLTTLNEVLRVTKVESL